MPIGPGGAAGQVGPQVGDGQPQQHRAHNADPHGRHGFTHAAHHALKHLAHRKGQIAKGQPPQAANAHFNHRGRIGKQADELSPKEQDAQHQHPGHPQGQLHQVPGARVNAVQPTGADVLPCIGGGRGAEGKVGHHGKAVHAHDGYAGSDHRRAQGVGQALHHNGRQGENGLGNARRQAQAREAAAQLPVQAQGVAVNVHGVPHAHQANQAQHPGHRLGHDGCPGHAGHPHAQVPHEIQVQHNVHQAGNHQIDQGVQAVSQAAQHTGKNVVHAAAQNADEDNLQILRGARGHLRGRSHHGHQPRRNEIPPHGHHQARSNGQKNGGAHRAAELLPVLGPEILGGKNARARGNAHEQHNEQVQDGAGGSHRRQGGVPHILAHDDAVHGVVQLLGQVAQQQGNGKPDQAVHGTAYGHILHAKGLLDLLHHAPILPTRFRTGKPSFPGTSRAVPPGTFPLRPGRRKGRAPDSFRTRWPWPRGSPPGRRRQRQRRPG